MHQFLRFCIVGGIGFVIDTGLLLLIVSVGVEPTVARLLSFLAAATSTYVLNRRFTFQQRGSENAREWMTYLLVTTIGAAINIGVFTLWISSAGTSRAELIVGVMLGSGAAMFVNFGLSRFLVFRTA